MCCHGCRCTAGRSSRLTGRTKEENEEREMTIFSKNRHKWSGLCLTKSLSLWFRCSGSVSCRLQQQISLRIHLLSNGITSVFADGVLSPSLTKPCVWCFKETHITQVNPPNFHISLKTQWRPYSCQLRLRKTNPFVFAEEIFWTLRLRKPEHTAKWAPGLLQSAAGD